MVDEKVRIKPTSLILNNLELTPYQYKEQVNSNGALTIKARINLSEEEYSDLGELREIIKVVRRGIDEEPREMELREIAWSEIKNKIKEEIWLFDKEEDKKSLPWMGYIGYSLKVVAEQSLVIDGLLDALVSEGILKEEKVKEIKAKNTKDSNWRKRREFYRSPIDLDEYKSLEEN